MVNYPDLRWAAAFLEGEGSFIFSRLGSALMCCAPQMNHWPLKELQRILGGNLNLRKHRISQWNAYGVAAGGVMLTLYSMMSPRRQGQIRKALASWRKLRPHYKFWTTCAQGHQFTRIEKRPDGRLRRFCVTCHNRQHKAWRTANPEKWRAIQHNAYYRDLEASRKRSREKAHLYRTRKLVSALLEAV